jgi:hypothetical protein
MADMVSKSQATDGEYRQEEIGALRELSRQFQELADELRKAGAAKSGMPSASNSISIS